jgi:hypothetical protein
VEKVAAIRQLDGPLAPIMIRPITQRACTGWGRLELRADNDLSKYELLLVWKRGRHMGLLEHRRKPSRTRCHVLRAYIGPFYTHFRASI